MNTIYPASLPLSSLQNISPGAQSYCSNKHTTFNVIGLNMKLHNDSEDSISAGRLWTFEDRGSVLAALPSESPQPYARRIGTYSHGVVEASERVPSCGTLQQHIIGIMYIGLGMDHGAFEQWKGTRRLRFRKCRILWMARNRLGLGRMEGLASYI
jgi:hypothetical protein